MKPFEVNLGNYRKSQKEHLVYYILRDHFSGNLIFRIATVYTLFPLAAFLYEAWNNEGGEGSLRGMPEELWVPKTIATVELFDGLQKLGVKADYPPSGFASGIRVIRDLEERLWFWLARFSDHTLENMARHTDDILKSMLSHTSQGDRRELWSNNLPPGHLRRPPAYADFLQVFPAETDETPLLLLPPDGEGRRKASVVPPAAPEQPKRSAGVQPAFSQAKLEQAERILDEAWDVESRERALALAIKALKISPYCVDAYNLLALESENRQEKIEFYQKAADAGRAALGELYFRKNAGHFWSLIETRPFMRAMEGLACELWKTGKTGEAVAFFQEMLRLNPNDNQGIRYLLLAVLLEEGRMAEAAQHIQDHEDASTAFAYGQALWFFCTTGPGGRSDACLKNALQSNPYVPAYLLGEKFVPYKEPDYYTLGDESEAVWYAQYALKAWKQRPEALAWLREAMKIGP